MALRNAGVDDRLFDDFVDWGHELGGSGGLGPRERRRLGRRAGSPTVDRSGSRARKSASSRGCAQRRCQVLRPRDATGSDEWKIVPPPGVGPMTTALRHPDGLGARRRRDQEVPIPLSSSGWDAVHRTDRYRRCRRSAGYPPRSVDDMSWTRTCWPAAGIPSGLHIRVKLKTMGWKRDHTPAAGPEVGSGHPEPRDNVGL